MPPASTSLGCLSSLIESISAQDALVAGMVKLLQTCPEVANMRKEALSTLRHALTTSLKG